MDITFNSHMLDLLMPLCRQYKLTPQKTIKLILEQRAAMEANNNGKEETKQN